MEKNNIHLSELIAPSFFELHKDICKNTHTHYWLKGGRGSCKSSFVSLEIILGIMKDGLANAVVIRKIGQNLRESVYEQLLWAVDALGVERLWEQRIVPLELKYMPTGQRIIFRGADNPRKMKSVKVRRGYIKFVWFEEADEFENEAEIRIINQSLLRGGRNYIVFYSYNPPKSHASWINSQAAVTREDKIVHHSTYLDVKKEWLGEQFFIEAKHLEKTKPEAYEHEYLGKITGTGGEVFKNLSLREITDEEIKGFDRISRGLDWGYAVDPLHYTVNHLDRTRRRLYIFFELNKTELSNIEAARYIKEENKKGQAVFCDSAEPKSIAELRGYGINAIAAKKGPDSVNFGVKWLQDLEQIIIDPTRCPNTAREFASYEYSRDANGDFRAAFPDKNNHSIDAVRYSREEDFRKVRVI